MQNNLLFAEEDLDEWRKEWQDMPEFVQDNLTPYKSLVVHFASSEDMKKFSKLIEQSLLSTTKSVWYPKANIGRLANKRFIDGDKNES